MNLQSASGNASHRRVGWFALLVCLQMLSCSSQLYVEPDEGPYGIIEIDSICIERAQFYARINSVRTQQLGCNQSGSWRVTPGSINLIVQIQQTAFAVEPMNVDFELEANECARFLLRQSGGYGLEFLGIRSCE